MSDYYPKQKSSPKLIRMQGKKNLARIKYAS